MTTRFREGTNQVLTMSSTTADDDKWFAPEPMLSIDSRGGCGPAWSPDGTKMAAIYEGVLAVWPVSPRRRAARPAAPHHHRERARPELERATRGTSSTSRSTSCGSSTSRPARSRRPARPEVHAGDPQGPHCIVHAGTLVDMKSDDRPRPTSTSSSRATDHQRRAARRREPHPAARSWTRRS